MSHSNESLKETCLAGRHVKLGARMVPFAGWRMPVQYAGIIEEHLHTRSQAGLFDTTHMGEFFLRGAGAGAALERLVTCRVNNLADGQARYGLLLHERGGVLDDLIVFRISAGEFMVVVNAGTRDKDRAWFEAHLGEGAEFRDESDAIAKLDLQGPRSGDVMARLAGQDILNLKRFHHRVAEVDGVPMRVSRTGYTGEFGYELFFPVEAGERIWDLLLSQPEVRPIGLGARDTLRLEKGLPLYGHELDEEHTPLEAGLDRFVALDKPFIGREALEAQQRAGLKISLAGFLCEGRRAAREGFEVRAAGRGAGRVTSGSFAPSLGRAVAMGYVEAAAAGEGTAVTLASGTTEIAAVVKRMPFV